MNNTLKLSPRLSAAASFVREGSFIADVGTDHAYLPIALVKEGRAKGAVASDINEGPYLCATKNVHEHSLAEKISTVHCPGLSGIDKFSPTDILICGMRTRRLSRAKFKRREWHQSLVT